MRSLRQSWRRGRFSRLLRIVRSGPWVEPLVAVYLLFVATIALRHQEGWPAADSFYFVVMVVTTIGYGDFAPSTQGGKLATCLLAIGGLGVIGRTIAQFVLGVAGPAAFLRRCLGHSAGLLEAHGLVSRHRARRRVLAGVCVGIVLLGSLLGRFVIGIPSWCDSLYFSVVTLTTVGFGDIVPNSRWARTCTAVVSLVLVPLFANALLSYVDLCRGGRGGDCGLVRTRGKLTEEGVAGLSSFSRENLGIQDERPVSREDYVAFVLVRNGLLNAEDVKLIWDSHTEMSVKESTIKLA